MFIFLLNILCWLYLQLWILCVGKQMSEYCTFQKVRQNFPEYLGFVEEILA